MVAKGHKIGDLKEKIEELGGDSEDSYYWYDNNTVCPKKTF